jgi:heme/copper-type cytochrome/quinol oxidase subunit 3
MAFITYGHHALIAGNRKAAIDGVILTIILAVIFTALQYFEYSEAGFTISDGVYGSAFYASTGLHGLITIVPIKIKNKNMFNSSNIKNINYNFINTLSSPPRAPRSCACDLYNLCRGHLRLLLVF